MPTVTASVQPAFGAKPPYLSEREWETSRLGRVVGVPRPLPLDAVDALDPVMSCFLDGTPGERLRGARVSRLRTVRDLERAVDAVAGLDEEAARAWALRGTEPPAISPDGMGGTVAYAAAVRGETVGFVLASRMTEANRRAGHDEFCYLAAGEFAYVAPSMRGSSLGQLLAACVARQMSADVSHVVGTLGAVSFRGTLRAEVLGDARSAQGAALLNRLSAHLAREVGRHSSGGALRFAAWGGGGPFAVMTAGERMRRID